MSNTQYLGTDGVPIVIGDYVKNINSGRFAVVEEFYEIADGTVLVSVSWSRGADIPAWLTEIRKAEPEELI